MEVASSNPITVLFVCVFFDFIFYQLIYLFIDIQVIHNHCQTTLVGEYRFNDI